jgi:hypothetical protein
MSHSGVSYLTAFVALAAVVPATSLAADIVNAPSARVAAPASFNQPAGGIYFGMRSGLGKAEDTSFSSAAGGTIDTQYDWGSYKGGFVGYRFGPLFGSAVSSRLELEVGVGNFSVDTHARNSVQQDSIDSFGSLDTISGFANGYFDFDLARLTGMGGPLAAVRPFVGGGVGAANVTLKKQGVSATGTLIDSSDTRFAYHLSAGVGIDISGIGFVRNTWLNNSVLEIGYRRMEVPDLTFTARDGTSSSTSFAANMVTFGLRRNF